MKNYIACPWCGWRNATKMMTCELSPNERTLYFVQCKHCGLKGRTSRFKWRARYFWNHRKSIPTILVNKEYHIYGKEY